MKIKRLIRGELQANGYIVYDEESGAAYIIDPGYDGDSYVETISQAGLKPLGILLTHHHYDHVGAVLDLMKKLNIPVYIHKADAPMLKLKAHVLLSDGDVLPLGKSKIKVVDTPGHTKGSCCYLISEENVAFTGDTIFNVDLGRTDLSDGSARQMRNSIEKVISKWDDDLVIYPGHGDPATMEYVRQNNWEYKEIMGQL